MNWTFRPAMLLMLGRTVGFAATFFIPLVLVRVFAPAEFGTYKQLFLIYGTVYPLAQLGMAESLYYFLPTGGRKVGRYLVNAALVLAASGLACWLALTVTREQVAAWMNNGRLAEYLPLIGLYLFLMLVATVLEITQIARQRYGTAAFTYAVSDVARTAALLLPALLFTSLRWLMLGAVAFAALRLLVTLFLLWRHASGQVGASRDLLREQVAYTAPFQLAIVFEILQANVHHFAVSWTFGAATYAIYAVGCLQIPLVDFVSSSVCNVLMVQTRQAWSEGDRRRVLDIWHAATRKLALLFVPLAVFLCLVARDLVTLLFTDAYAAAAPVFIVWTMLILLMVVQSDGILRVFAETRFLALMNVVRLAVVLGTIGWLMGVLGLPGAVLATVLATVVGKALALGRAARDLEVSPLRMLPWRPLATIAAATGAAALPSAWLLYAAGGSEATRLIAAAAVFWGSFLVAASWLDALEEDERSVLTAWFSRLRPAPARPTAPRPAPPRPGVPQEEQP